MLALPSPHRLGTTWPLISDSQMEFICELLKKNFQCNVQSPQCTKTFTFTGSISSFQHFSLAEWIPQKQEIISCVLRTSSVKYQKRWCILKWSLLQTEVSMRGMSGSRRPSQRTCWIINYRTSGWEVETLLHTWSTYQHKEKHQVLTLTLPSVLFLSPSAGEHGLGVLETGAEPSGPVCTASFWGEGPLPPGRQPLESVLLVLRQPVRPSCRWRHSNLHPAKSLRWSQACADIATAKKTFQQLLNLTDLKNLLHIYCGNLKI